MLKANKKMDNYYEFEFDNKKYFFRKYPEDKYKNLVFCCAKNEDEYIREYIEHYLKIGFDKIIIVDNNEEPGLEKIIEDHIARGSVQIFPFNGVHGYFQNAIYTMFMNYGNYKWCAYFDCDEFLEISGKYDNVEQMLDEANADAFMVQWMCFGANGKISKEEGGVQERFPLPASPVILYKENMITKTILRGGIKGFFSTPHNVVFDGEGVKKLGGYIDIEENESFDFFPLYYKKCFLKHYITKSFEEYQRKISKPRIASSEDTLKSFFNIYQNTAIIESFFSKRFFSITHEKILDEALRAYRMIAYMGNEDRPLLQYDYPLYSMLNYSGKVIVVNEETLNEIFFATMQEIAIKTKNILIACKNDVDVLWNIFLKYKKEGEETYYIYGGK